MKIEKTTDISGIIKGAEGIVIHNGNIVLGMQKPKRWYNLENGNKGTVIKTIGGQIEDEDKNSSKQALIREILEEVKGIENKDFRISEEPIFTKKIKMRDLNIKEKTSNLKLEADFYLLEILSKKDIEPNDLPALLEIPLKEFLQLEFNIQEKLSKFQKYIIKNKNYKKALPDYCTLMIPKEVKKYLEKVKEKL